MSRSYFDAFGSSFVKILTALSAVVMSSHARAEDINFSVFAPHGLSQARFGQTVDFELKGIERPPQLTATNEPPLNTSFAIFRSKAGNEYSVGEAVLSDCKNDSCTFQFAPNRSVIFDPIRPTDKLSFYGVIPRERVVRLFEEFDKKGGEGSSPKKKVIYPIELTFTYGYASATMSENSSSDFDSSKFFRRRNLANEIGLKIAWRWFYGAARFLKTQIPTVEYFQNDIKSSMSGYNIEAGVRFGLGEKTRILFGVGYESSTFGTQNDIEVIIPSTTKIFRAIAGVEHRFTSDIYRSRSGTFALKTGTVLLTAEGGVTGSVKDTGAYRRGTTSKIIDYGSRLSYTVSTEGASFLTNAWLLGAWGEYRSASVSFSGTPSPAEGFSENSKSSPSFNAVGIFVGKYYEFK